MAAAAPTNPAGSPTTKAGSTSRRRISASAAAPPPTTQTAPGPASPKASRTAAAALEMPAVLASRWVSGSLTLQRTGLAVIPAATMAVSTITAAPAASAATPSASASSSQIRSV